MKRDEMNSTVSMALDDLLDNARRDGREAFLRGDPPKFPHDGRTRVAKAWNQGWLQAFVRHSRAKAEAE